MRCFFFMADDVKGQSSSGEPVGESSGFPKELVSGTVIEGNGLSPKKVPSGKKIVNFVMTWTGLLVDE